MKSDDITSNIRFGKGLMTLSQPYASMRGVAKVIARPSQIGLISVQRRADDSLEIESHSGASFDRQLLHDLARAGVPQTDLVFSRKWTQAEAFVGRAIVNFFAALEKASGTLARKAKQWRDSFPDD